MDLSLSLQSRWQSGLVKTRLIVGTTVKLNETGRLKEGSSQAAKTNFPSNFLFRTLSNEFVENALLNINFYVNKLVFSQDKTDCLTIS